MPSRAHLLHATPVGLRARRSLPAALALAYACLCSMPALAQWQWVDKDGRKVFSDKAPPPDVPERSILRRPGMRAATPAGESGAATAAAQAPAAAASAAAAAPKLAGKDRELEEKKKQADQAAEAKKKEVAEQVAKAQAENCARAKQAKVTYDSGVRVARVNAKGEREIMDDKARADEVKRLDAVIARDCKVD